MKVTKLLPVAGMPLASGARILARFNLEFAEGVTCRLALVQSGRDGSDILWSSRGEDGPSVKFSRDTGARVIAMARAELSALAAALRAA